MKSIFDQQTNKELLQRIEALSQDNHALWVKMTVYQMLKHYESIVHLFFGKKSRKFLGQLAYKHADHHLRQFGV